MNKLHMKNTVTWFFKPMLDIFYNKYSLIDRYDNMSKKLNLKVRDFGFIPIHHIHGLHSHSFLHISLRKELVVYHFLKANNFFQFTSQMMLEIEKW